MSPQVPSTQLQQFIVMFCLRLPVPTLASIHAQRHYFEEGCRLPIISTMNSSV